MSDKPTSMAAASPTFSAIKPVNLKVDATVFVPLSKQTTEATSEVVDRLPTGELIASESGQIVPTSEDALSTPTPASISSFAELVKAAREAPPPDSAEVSMMSMTDDDDESEISSADISVAVEPKTPLLPLSQSELSDLDVSPTGGLGGGVRCGIPKPVEPAAELTTGNRVFEGLVPQKADHDDRPKYRPYPPQRSCNIHIQNLPAHYGDAELSILCGEFGRIVSVRVFRRPVAAPPNRRLPDGQHSTYGFVLFDNVISAEKCVNVLRQRYKNIYPSFARQAAPAVHQPAFVGLLEAMAYGDLHQADPNLNAYACEQSLYQDQAVALPLCNVPTYDVPASNDTLPAKVVPAYEAAPETTQPPLIPASVEIPVPQTRPRALTIKPMPPPIQSFVKPSTTTDRINSVLNESSILLIVDGLPKDFGVGLLDTLFAPHAIHDVRLHRQGASDAVRGSVRVSNRVAALQSVEKLSGMQFGSSAGGLRVRLAEEVSGGGSESDLGTVPSLPSYRTLPDIQDGQTLLAPPNGMEGPLSSSISAPAVASMIGSGLNQLLFASDSNESLTLGSQRIPGRSQLSPSTGRLLASPAHFAIPFTPAIASSISMPHVAPRFLTASQSYNLLPSLRVGNVNLPITNLFPSSNSLYACGNTNSADLQETLAAVQPIPEPPVIKVSSYASAVKKPTVRMSSSEDQKAKKRKSRRPNKNGKVESEKSSPEVEANPTMNEKGSEEKARDQEKSKPVGQAKASAEEKPTLSSPEQPKSTSSKGKQWHSARRRSNSKPAAATAKV